MTNTSTPTHIRTGKVRQRLDAAGIPYSIVRWSKEERCYLLEAWESDHPDDKPIKLPGCIQVFEDKFHAARIDIRDSGAVVAFWRTPDPLDAPLICIWVKFTLPR